MSTNIVQIGTPQSAIQQGGVGFGGRMFQIKPATLELTQKTTRGAGVIPGKLRVKETNAYVDFMHAVLLFEPQEGRQCYEKDAPIGGSSPICYSLDAKTPSDRAKYPQATNCANCPKGSWEKWKKSKSKDDLPECSNYYRMLLIDRVTQIPYRFKVNGLSIKEMFTGMNNIAMLAQVMISQGQNPNLFDFSFKITPEYNEKKGVYIVKFTEPAPIKEEDRAKFGGLYMQFLQRQQEMRDVEESDNVEQTVNAAVTNSGAQQPEEEPISI